MAKGCRGSISLHRDVRGGEGRKPHLVESQLLAEVTRGAGPNLGELWENRGQTCHARRQQAQTPWAHSCPRTGAFLTGAFQMAWLEPGKNQRTPQPASRRAPCLPGPALQGVTRSHGEKAGVDGHASGGTVLCSTQALEGGSGQALVAPQQGPVSPCCISQHTDSARLTSTFSSSTQAQAEGGQCPPAGQGQPFGARDLWGLGCRGKAGAASGREPAALAAKSAPLPSGTGKQVPPCHRQS